MVDIYHCKIVGEMPVQQWEKYIAMLPPAHMEKIRRFRRWEDRHLHLFARLLLRQGLLKYGYEENILDAIQTNAFNKPFLNEDIDFSISHSGRYAICALSKDGRLGVDVEKKDRQFDLALLGDILSPEEMGYVLGSNDKCDAFFRIWTRKESLIKADGRGFSASPLDQINCLADEVILEEKKWFIRDLDLDNDFSAALSTDIANPVVHFIPIEF
jgi:4'-phosphopantetheinyl transferase